MSSTLARNSALNVAAGASTTIGAFLGNIAIARLLGVQGTGVVAFATWLTMMAGAAIDVGVPGALGRYLPGLHARNDPCRSAGLIWYLFKRMTVAASAVVLAICAIAVWSSYRLGFGDAGNAGGNIEAEPLFWLLIGVSSVAQALAGFVNGYLQGTQTFGLLARLAIYGASLRLVSTLVLASLLGIAGALLGPIIGALASIAILPRVLAGPKARAERELQSRVRRYMWESWGSYILTAFVAARMEIAFLQLNWGSAGVSLYSVGLTFANLATTGALMMAGPLLPYLAQLSHADQVKAREAYRTAMRMMSLLLFPVCLGMAAVLPRLLPLLYGRDFDGAIPAGVLLVSTSAITSVSTVSFIYLLAMERTRFLFATGAIGTALMIVAGLTVVPIFGPEGAAVSRAAVSAIMTATNVWYVTYRLHCPIPLAWLARLLCASALCALAARSSLDLIAGPASLPLAIAAGVIVFAVAVRLLRIIEPGDAVQLRSIAAALPAAARPLAHSLVRILSRSWPDASIAQGSRGTSTSWPS